MSLCRECGCDCMLVSLDCIYQYTPLSNGNRIETKKDAITHAHINHILPLFGEECYKTLCEEANKEDSERDPKWEAVLKNLYFKMGLSQLIYYYYIKAYGWGSITPNGALSDENRLSLSEINKIAETALELGNSYLEKLKNSLLANPEYAFCFPCLEVKTKCGCGCETNNCGCESHKQKSLTFDIS